MGCNAGWSIILDAGQLGPGEKEEGLLLVKGVASSMLVMTMVCRNILGGDSSFSRASKLLQITEGPWL